MWQLKCSPQSAYQHFGRRSAPLTISLFTAPLEWDELRAALGPLEIKLSQHHYTPHPDEWFYYVPEICGGGPCESAADALRTATRHVRPRAIEQRQELDEMVRTYQELRAKLNQTTVRYSTWLGSSAISSCKSGQNT